jgi:hypothetical protein
MLTGDELEAKLCPVCHGLLPVPATRPDDRLEVSCPRCGAFTCTRTAATLLMDDADESESGEPRLGPWRNRKRSNASAYVRENQGMMIGSDDLGRLATLRTPTFHARADKLLLQLERATKDIGQQIDISGPQWEALGWCRNDRELAGLANALIELGHLKPEHKGTWASVAITPAGWAHLEGLRAHRADSSQGFIAMHLDPSLDPLWHALEAGIEAAGYEPLRIDRKLDADKLDDEILAEIQRSRFIVADLTHQRQSVYLEIGFAMGLRMRVFRTCRQDDISNLHFDQKTYHCTPWVAGKEGEVAKVLRARIVARCGEGTKKPSQ